MNAEVSRVSDSGLPSYGALDEEAGTSGQGMGDEVVTSLVDIDQEAEGGERTDNEKTVRTEKVFCLNYWLHLIGHSVLTVSLEKIKCLARLLSLNLAILRLPLGLL